MKQSYFIKRDNLLVRFLAEHKGGANCLSSKDISEYLSNNGYPTTVNAVHNIIRRIMFERTLPICQINSKGYFWAENSKEIQSSIDDLRGRIEELQARIELLQNFIVF